MEERSYDEYDPLEPSRPSYGRMIIASIAIILVGIGLYLSVAYPLIESEVYVWTLLVFLIPMACMASCAACAWGKGRSFVHTDVTIDERIFEEMHLRASRAIQVGLDWYRCPECQEAFEISNAKPVDNRVFLCPFCDSRLITE